MKGGPGGASFLAAVVVVCLTVWVIFLASGEADPRVVDAWLGSRHG